MSDIAPSQASRVNEGEEAFKSQIVPGSKIPQSGGGNGGMGGNLDENFKFGEGINIGTSSLDAIIPKGGAFEGDLFAWADGALAMGKISYHDFFEMAKKMGLKLDVSVVKETGADLGANMSLISGGQGQER
jgi:hypothetical protein